MKRKLKFITSVGMLSLSVFMLVVGVYALVQRQVNIGGTVSFSASTIRADYQVLKTEAYAGEALGAFTEVGSGSFNLEQQGNADVQLNNNMLSDNANRFAYRVILTSTEAVRDLVVTHTIPAPAQAWLDIEFEDSATETGTAITLAQGQSLTFTFVIIADPMAAPESAEEIEIGSNFTISLTDEDNLEEMAARAARQQTQRQAMQNNTEQPSTNQNTIQNARANQPNANQTRAARQNTNNQPNANQTNQGNTARQNQSSNMQQPNTNQRNQINQPRAANQNQNNNNQQDTQQAGSTSNLIRQVNRQANQR